MDKFFIIANRQKDKELKTARKVEAYLNSKGKSCILREETSEQKVRSNHYTDVEKIPKDVECIIVIGGDGTLLQAARDVVNRQIPLLGINMGTLGYLAEIDRSSIDGALNHLMLDEYTIEKRMMLNGKVYHKEELIAEDVALNDIVIGRDGPLHVTRFHNYVNGEFLNSYTADGIIIATATGSTGYSLSAGGPIVSPETNILIMTPVAPHTLNTRSVIFPAEDEITVEIGEGSQGCEAKAVVSFDGDTNVPMRTADRVAIRRSVKDTQIIKISNISFLEVLRRKMKN
ncbi:NAD(+)/NADH kinase [Blautia stercoris]|uniref:NAD(+)/NADH kinase n=1 Tax=Blautia stercoris TaxID=871664 RepID=UPI000335C26A|nr:NAD(+)/NADH kinase [Blautia stercoris]CDC92546.1 probable inorganic polyphosphate/ATP-NAD kinase [Firmicutes bacterium CAG:227]